MSSRRTTSTARGSSIAIAEQRLTESQAEPLGELELIADLGDLLRCEDPRIVRWLGDDAAVTRAGAYAVTSVDTMIEGVHFRVGELTAAENMELHGVLYHVPRKIRIERTEELLKLFDLWDRRQTVVKEFSGGMKRRLEIARGLLHTPKILFLDEPTLGLDPQSRNQLWTHVKSLNETEGVTVFLTTHYMDEAERVAHRIAIIDHGRIVAQGTPAELKEQTGADSLEGAFLALTGSSIRDEKAGSVDQMRQFARMWRGGR